MRRQFSATDALKLDDTADVNSLGRFDFARAMLGISICANEVAVLSILSTLYREILLKKLKPRSAHAAARGPNGRPTQYNGRGELVEKNIDEHGQKFDLLIGRSHSDIKKRHRHCSDRVWFKQHQEVLRSAETNEGQFDEKQRAMLEKAQERVRRIESEYSNELLSFDDLSFAYLCGQLAALAWVLGAGDEDCLDT